MQLEVTNITKRSLGVKSFELRSLDASPLPQFEPGAHIRITIPALTGPETSRAYSLVSDPRDSSRYEIAVLQVEPGNGGSAWMHQFVKPGDLLEVSEPRNDFRIEDEKAHSILFAGGIGITPILSLARELAHIGTPYEVHYVARGLDRMPYTSELTDITGGNARLYTSRQELDLSRVIQPAKRSAHFYVCGPHALIEAVRHNVAQAGIAATQLHFEAFGYRPQPGDREVQVELSNSGLFLQAIPGRPLLETIEAAGGWIPADCRKGECGTCITNILEGTADHRDHCLTPDQRTTMMCPCVSWPASERLILEV